MSLTLVHCLPTPHEVHSKSSWPAHSEQVGWQRTHWFFNANCPLGHGWDEGLLWIQPTQNRKTSGMKLVFMSNYSLHPQGRDEDDDDPLKKNNSIKLEAPNRWTAGIDSSDGLSLRQRTHKTSRTSLLEGIGQRRHWRDHPVWGSSLRTEGVLFALNTSNEQQQKYACILLL